MSSGYIMSRELLASPARPDAEAPASPGDRAALRAAPALRRRLLVWYHRHKRPMPWRGLRDPYRIWVSEVMLQQTQVATARPFYQRFITRFPTLGALSRARESDVLAAWAGLGYYRRARNLREAARLVVREHAGRVPDDPDAFGRLPGVGRYTTGAVLSIAFDRSLPALDGNVARVLSRLFALPATLRDPRGAKALWALAHALVPARGAGDWNQAIMELGATLCLPRAPRCEVCPVRTHCRALALGRVGALPPVAPRRRSETVRRAVALIERRGRMLVVRLEGPLLEGMWEPPGVDLMPGRSPRRALAAGLAGLGLSARLSPTGHTLRHTITHRDIEVEIWRASLTVPARRARCLRFVEPAAPAVPLTALARKLALFPRGARHGATED
jgi:A/G-specific adenine glycosylase